jgi:hypothetical protein
VQLVEALAAWPDGEVGAVAAARRIRRLGLDPALVEQAGHLLSTAPVSAAQVVDAQYGGILSDSADVLVVVQWWRRTADGALHTGGTTVQVLLSAATPRWTVTQVVPARPGPPSSDPPPLARAVLANDRILLPTAARADVATGTIAAGVLTALLAIAREHTVHVSVVRSGHPYFVFGTDRVSDHPRGRAVDIWSVDGRPVVDPANLALTESVMRAGAALGAWQVGGPVQLEGAGTDYFTDHTHHDHVHWGFLG